MADVYNIVIVPTYDEYTLAVVDASTYDPSAPASATINIQVPAFDTVDVDFVPETTNIYNSTDLGITTAGNEEPLPDGIYCFKYEKQDSNISVSKRILRTDQLQKKFDEAFMKIDMLECDGPIKKQYFVDLMTIYFFIQGAIASANNCATIPSTKLYIEADKMLDAILNKDCGCSGDNYTVNFQ